VPRAFQKVQETLVVRFLVGKRVGERIPHPRLGSQVADHAYGAAGENALQPLEIADINLKKLESPGFFQHREAGLLERRVVRAVDIVNANDAPAVVAHFFGNVKSDEPCGTRHEDHVFDLSMVI
jgi:hypothetical protein